LKEETINKLKTDNYDKIVSEIHSKV